MAFLDETGLAHFWNQILARLNNFVPAESGKGLSSNDYTTEEKEKLAGIEEGANKITVDSALSSSSTNPVQNQIINAKFDSVQASINNKVDKVDGKGLSTNDYTTDEKNKLSNIEDGAQVNVIETIKANGVTLAINNKTVTIPDYPVESVDGEIGEVVLNDVKYVSQTLTSQQKSQARTNIGAGTSNVIVTLKTWTSSDMR